MYFPLAVQPFSWYYVLGEKFLSVKSSEKEPNIKRLDDIELVRGVLYNLVPSSRSISP